MRQFDAHTTWEDVQNMTVEEAIVVLSHDADSDGKEWSARPHKAKAAQMAIEVLQRIDNANSCSRFIYDLQGTGIGTVVKIKCPICGAEEDMTDIESW